MPWFKLKKIKSPQSPPQPVPPRVPSNVDTPPPDIGRKSNPADTVSKGKLRSVGVEIDEFVLTMSTDVNDPGGSQIAPPRDDHGDDVARGYADGKAVDDGPLERDDDQETPSNVPLDHKHILRDTLSEREPETLDRPEYDPVVERPTETPLAVFGGHFGGDAPDLVQSERSEREWW